MVLTALGVTNDKLTILHGDRRTACTVRPSSAVGAGTYMLIVKDDAIQRDGDDGEENGNGRLVCVSARTGCGGIPD